MDVDDVSYRKVVEQLTELYGKKIAPYLPQSVKTANL